MRQNGPHSPFEVYCYQCHVTAPKGTRRCVHCGGRLSRDTAPPEEHLAHPLELSPPTDETAGGLAKKISPMTFVWILLAIGTALRLC